ncbi:MAG: hypothetical protein JWP89_2873 [Schlesneria sp.]|nr:hypothetical protein [Schlesneria sp.]
MNDDVDTLHRMHRWLLAEEIGVSAFYLLSEVCKPPHFDQEELLRASNHVARLLESYRFSQFFHTLPHSTVNLLWKARFRLPKVFRNDIQTAYKTFTLGNMTTNARDPATSIAAVLASVILNGTGDARRVARLGKSLFKSSAPPWVAVGLSKRRSWRPFLDQEECERTGFVEALSMIRDPNTPSLKRLKAVARLCSIVNEVPGSEQLENALFHQCFTWPLVVTDHGAFAVPVLVDAILPAIPSGPRLREGVNPPNVIGHTGVIDLSFGQAPTFNDWLRRACQAAHDLWRTQHGSTRGFREAVADFRGSFDFTFASEVVKRALPTLDPEKGDRLRVTGASASAYFAQVLLGRLLGRSSYMNVIITGEIGDKIEDEEYGFDILDYKFNRIDGVTSKLEYVFNARFNDAFIAPAQNSDEIESMLNKMHEERPTSGRHNEIDYQQTAQVVYSCARLSDVANAAQAMGWRRTQYIRCPDVGHQVQGWKSARRKHDSFALRPTVWRVLGVLNRSTSAIVKLPTGIWPGSVGQALEYINYDFRRYDIAPDGGLLELKYPQPSLSWAFVRMSANEEDEEFWQLVCRTIGAPVEEFEQFCCSPTPAIAANQFVELLNKFVPELDRRSHRAPDIIVLIGFEEACKSFESCKNPASRPLAPSAVIRAVQRIQERLQTASHRAQSRSPRVWAALQRVRIVLMSDEPIDSSHDELRIDELDTDVLSQLRSLAVFDAGFTQQSAAMVLNQLGVLGRNVKETLKKLKDVRINNSPALGEFGGDYFIPIRLWAQLRNASAFEVPYVKAIRYRAAAKSLAPYTARGSMLGIPLERSLLPECVIEARKYFEFAIRQRQQAIGAILQSAIAAGPEKTKKELRRWKEMSDELGSEIQTTERAATWPGRGLIQHQIERNTFDALADAEHLVQKLIHGWQNHPCNYARIPPHPMLWLASARSLAGSESVHVNRSPGAVAEVCQRFNRALQVCLDFPRALMSANERKWNTLHVKCWYTQFLRRHERESDTLGRAALLDGEIWQEQKFWSSALGNGFGSVPAEWIEAQGDEAKSTSDAFNYYLVGYKLYPDWQQFRFKVLGASCVAFQRIPIELANWLDRCDDPFVEIASFALCCSRSKRQCMRSVFAGRVQTYWQEAANTLRAAWEKKNEGFTEALWSACQAHDLIGRERWISLIHPNGWC